MKTPGSQVDSPVAKGKRREGDGMLVRYMMRLCVPTVPERTKHTMMKSIQSSGESS